MMMPNMNGLELVSEVKEQYPLMPIILMTSLGSEEIAVQALQNGAASYVPKRYLSRDLAQVVRQIAAMSAVDPSLERIIERCHTASRFPAIF